MLDLGEQEVSHVQLVVEDCRVEWDVTIVTLLRVDELWEVGHHSLHTPAYIHTYIHTYNYTYPSSSNHHGIRTHIRHCSLMIAPWVMVDTTYVRITHLLPMYIVHTAHNYTYAR